MERIRKIQKEIARLKTEKKIISKKKPVDAVAVMAISKQIKAKKFEMTPFANALRKYFSGVWDLTYDNLAKAKLQLEFL